MKFSFLPLTPKNWREFELLFGPKGACGGCWCMTWRLKAADYEKMKGEGNKKAMKELLKKSSPGIIAYAGNKPAGWCAVAPRKEYIRLETSRVLKPVDDKPVWSVSCFFIAKEFRNKGLSAKLLKAAVDFAFSNKATIVEGYPVESKNDKMPAVFAWTGFSSVFRKVGFKEVARRSETRPVMRIVKRN
ncbi:MAG TPA: GNAT family N-acetyltransferase [Chitinophagaceae bacterium]